MEAAPGLAFHAHLVACGGTLSVVAAHGLASSTHLVARGGTLSVVAAPGLASHAPGGTWSTPIKCRCLPQSSDAVAS